MTDIFFHVLSMYVKGKKKINNLLKQVVGFGLIVTKYQWNLHIHVLWINNVANKFKRDLILINVFVNIIWVIKSL
jgi:hypothetical protein